MPRESQAETKHAPINFAWKCTQIVAHVKLTSHTSQLDLAQVKYPRIKYVNQMKTNRIIRRATRTSLNLGSGIADRSMGARSMTLMKRASSTVMAHRTWTHLRSREKQKINPLLLCCNKWAQKQCTIAVMTSLQIYTKITQSNMHSHQYTHWWYHRWLLLWLTYHCWLSAELRPSENTGSSPAETVRHW